MKCSNDLHDMTPDNTHFGKGLACLACFRDASDASDNDLPPVPPGHRVVGWLLTDENGIAVDTFPRLTAFVDAYSKHSRSDAGVTRYDGPPAGYRLKRITEPRRTA